MSKKKKNNKLSIYLLKPGFDSSNSIRDEYNMDSIDNDLFSSATCKTFSVKSIINSPSWLSSFYGVNDNTVLTAFPRVVSIYTIVIDGENVSFAVPFGGGKSMLVSDSIVDDFGLRVLLNSVDMDHFRQLQIADCGKNFRYTSSQLPKLGNIDDFVFDFNTEILKKAVAKCDDELFANNNIIGGEGISITGPYKCDNIESFLIECYRRYKSDNYKDLFPWLDNIKEVKDSTLKVELEGELVRNINDLNFENVWMAVPDMIDWDKISCFKFRMKDEGENDIYIESFIKLFDQSHIDNFQQITNRTVFACDLNGNDVISWQAHKCLMAELNYKGNVFCFNSGKWYVVNQDYGKEIEQYYNNLKVSKIDFIDCYDINEKDYNIKLSESLAGSYVMDRNNIQALESGRSPVELCDVLTSNNELIHVKRGESSSYLSHLFNQARVSCDLLGYQAFRERANEKIGTNYFKKDFQESDYTVVLGIITNKEGEKPKIPFFSKVAIKYLVQELNKMGYKIELKNILNKLNCS